MGLFGPPDVEKLKTRGDVKGLIKALAYPKEAGVRMAAAKALGQLKDGRSVPALILALQDDTSAVCDKACEALGKITGQLQDAALFDRVMQQLLVMLKEKGPDDYHPVARALAAIGAPAVPALIKAFQSHEFSLDWKAADALGQTGDPRAIEPLMQSTLHGDDRKRRFAAEALKKFSGAGVTGQLLKALKEGEGHVREKAAYALGGCVDKEVVEALLPALEDREDDVREAVHWALGKAAIQGFFPKSRAKKLFTEALKDPTFGVRAKGVWALGELGGAEVVEILIRMLSDESSAVRIEAAAALGNLGDVRARNPLQFRARNDEVIQVMAAAQKALKMNGWQD
jgi:HEAT repeat protein